MTFSGGEPLIRAFELTPFQAAASHKYDSLNVKNDFTDVKCIGAGSEMIKEFTEIFKSYNINIMEE